MGGWVCFPLSSAYTCLFFDEKQGTVSHLKDHVAGLALVGWGGW